MRIRLSAAVCLAAGCLAGSAGFAPSRAAAAGGEVSVLASGSIHEALFAAALSADGGVAVGAAGEIRETRDGGKTWSTTTAAGLPTLLGVAMDGTREVAVGLKGTVLVRSGGGAWTKADSGTDSRLLAVGMNASGTAVIVGAFGTLLKSTDGGRRWASIAPKWADISTDGVEPNLYAVDVADDGTITVAGEFGTILRSSDGGTTWESRHKGEAALFGLDLRRDGVGYAVGQDGTVLKTADHGVTWQPLDMGSKPNLLSVKSAANGAVYATGMHEILASGDEGKTWRNLDAGAAGGLWLAGMAGVPGASSVIAVGQTGQILQLGK